MLLDVAVCLTLLLSSLGKLVEGTILCSNCRSDTHPECEVKPPEPQPCAQVGSGQSEACSTVRVTQRSTGMLKQFVRSCASTSEKGACFDRDDIQTCIALCFTDGCNSALTFHRAAGAWLWCMLGTLVLLSLKLIAG